MKFCWKENQQDTFFSLDKVQHILFYATMTAYLFLFVGLFSIPIVFIVSLGVERFEGTELWDRITKFLDPNSSKTNCISIKDLIANLTSIVLVAVWLKLLFEIIARWSL